VIKGYLNWAILAAFVFGYALLAGRLKRTPASAAMVFLLGGLTPRNKELELAAAEGAGDVLSLITWMAFGSAVLGRALGAITPATLA
jgi:hypothetical protein